MTIIGGFSILPKYSWGKGESPKQLRRSSSRKYTLVVIFLAFMFTASLISSEVAAAKEFKTVFFSFGDVVVFSYQDGLTFSIYSSNGTKITTQSLDKGKAYLSQPGKGVYRAVGDKPFSVLMGDPVSASIMGYFAADDSFRGVAKEFYSYVASDQDVIVFAYSKGATDVTVTEWNGQAWVPLSQFTLNGPGGHNRIQKPAWSKKWLHFIGSQPISVEFYSDRCFAVPAETGLWAGKHFYLFAGWYGDATPGDNIHIHSYKDANQVTVRNIGGDQIWSGTINEGEMANIDRQTIGVNKFIEVTSTETVTVTDETFWTQQYYGFLGVPDQSGTGVGTKFYTYARESPPSGVGGIWAFAYQDGTKVEIRDMTANKKVVWSGTLNANENHNYIPPTGSGGHLFSVFSDNNISVIQGSGGWGATFVPLYSAAIAEKMMIESPVDGEVIESSKVTMRYHSADTSVQYYEVRIDGGSWMRSSTDSYTFSGLSMGSHTLEARSVSTDGTVGIPTMVTITSSVWVPPAETAVSSVALVGVAFAVSNAAGAPINFLGDKLYSLVPDFVKKWIEDLIASKSEMSIDQRTGSIFTLTRQETIAYAVSLSTMTFAFSYSNAVTLSQFLIAVPVVLATSIVIEFTKNVLIAMIARSRGVWTEHRIWFFGLIMFLASTLIFKTPFSSPSRNVHHSTSLTRRLLGGLASSSVLIGLGLAAIFYEFLILGVPYIGGIGLGMCLLMTLFDSIPLKGMNGVDIYMWNRVVWAVLFITTLALYLYWLLIL
jgi:hypothetical protein